MTGLRTLVITKKKLTP